MAIATAITRYTMATNGAIVIAKSMLNSGERSSWCSINVHAILIAHGRLRLKATTTSNWEGTIGGHNVTPSPIRTPSLLLALPSSSFGFMAGTIGAPEGDASRFACGAWSFDGYYHRLPVETAGAMGLRGRQ